MSMTDTYNVDCDLRLELRTRNNRLWHAVFDLHSTMAEFCRVHAFQQSIIGGLLNLTRSPIRRRSGLYTSTAQRVAEVTGIVVGELFPLDLATTMRLSGFGT